MFQTPYIAHRKNHKLFKFLMLYVIIVCSEVDAQCTLVFKSNSSPFLLKTVTKLRSAASYIREIFSVNALIDGICVPLTKNYN